ncbi:MAG: hypothetical protein P8R40_04845, partial [SAR324 cluster bacterium]|nr:hypothetical protein [SAR324 cluster bacterium]
IEVDDRVGGKRSIPDSPYKFQQLEAGVRAGAPHLGEHNEEVLRQWLGWTDEEISAVQAAMLTSTTK